MNVHMKSVVLNIIVICIITFDGIKNKNDKQPRVHDKPCLFIMCILGNKALSYIKSKYYYIRYHFYVSHFLPISISQYAPVKEGEQEHEYPAMSSTHVALLRQML